MFKERLTDLKKWLKDEFEWYKESDKFRKVFGYGDPNGVLTRPGEEMHSLHRGVITAGLSFSSMRKIIKGENLSEEERRRVREAAWLNSISGTYSLNLLPEGGVRVAITIDNYEALNYLTSNANKKTMMTFLGYRDRHYRHKEAESVGVIEDENSTWWLSYTFPQMQQPPTEESLKHTSLHIYTRPPEDSKINTKFLRLNLLLWNMPKQTD